ncbi:hypothetical protein JOC85_002241 [Bacillus mesophilus]|nr:hypothetical protein [Bacillus mesophilus]MBM7661438.1 hypothetical protein [Bacillus mesophilus]
MKEKNLTNDTKESSEICESITEDRYFWNELHIIVEDGVNASKDE